MDITVVAGAIQDQDIDLLVVNHFEKAEALAGATATIDAALAGAINEVILVNKDFKGKPNETLVVYSHGQIKARRVLVVGLGPQADFTLERARQAAGTAARKARELGARRIATIVHSAGDLAPQACAEALAEGTLLGLYQFNDYKSKKDDKAIDACLVVEADADKLAAVTEGVRVGRIIAEATAFARNLVNHPSNIMTPPHMAEHAGAMADKYGLKCTVLETADMQALKMGALLAVAIGSEEPPKFVILEHKPANATGAPIILVGKGVTFDTGGISIKPSERMEEMKSDMGGAAAVYGAMQAIAALGLPQHVIGITPVVENMPDGRAYRPGDVLTASNGKTIEVISTDAEGRLILADALVYANRYNPALVIDLATLTGACVVALGDDMAAGMFGTAEDFKPKLMAASDKTHERLWPMPLWEEYKERIASLTADMKNTGGRFGGVATSAWFLREFAEGYPWIHLDIAPMALSERDRPYLPKGATGFGVRLLTQLVRDWQ